jgi:hypothetical protein
MAIIRRVYGLVLGNVSNVGLFGDRKRISA